MVMGKSYPVATAFPIETRREIAIVASLCLVFDGLPLDQQRISKLMGAIVPLVNCRVHAVENLVVGERSE